MSDGEEIPKTQFTILGDDRIAYQVFGEGDVDLVFAPAMGDCIDLRWYWPPYASFLRQLGTEARVIMFDRQGTGASDSPSGEVLPSWERWADEARVVLDEVGSEQAVILGSIDAGATAILFAASQPSRTRGLILANSTSHFAENLPARISEDVALFTQGAWGTEALAEFGAPDSARDPMYRRWAAMNQRLSLRPNDARSVLRHHASMDVRVSLASVRVPTLVLHRQGYTAPPPEHGRYLADNIPGARLALVSGNDGVIYSEPVAEILGHIKEFLSGLRGTAEPDRALAAILFTDIVGSTAQASTLGDRAWRNLLESHDAVTRTIVEQHHGRIVKMTGDGVLATFDGPGRAIRCSTALGDALRPLGLEIRAGLHTGEVEVRGADIAGIGVHIAARVLDVAGPGELIVSAAVPMLVAGSGFEFEDRGEHDLKGVSETWRLFALRS
jgi:class 3 adenylate cyclase/alpha-beta hydrolase superfamily lysophospholipase